MTAPVRKLGRDDRLVVATHNPGKAREIDDLLRPFGVSAVSAGELGLPEPEETGDTFEANAELKAVAAAEASGLPALADDSGFCADALGGRPGIYSARWAGPAKDFSVAMRKVWDEMQGADDRNGHFVCVLALAWPGGPVTTYRGEAAGLIVWPPRGDKGFGYDPMFQPSGHDRTFGEMPADEKHDLSHRAHAFRKFVDACLERR